MKDTKDFILQTAYNMFLCNNYEAVTFSSICKATGLTKGAIYHHYASKEDLFKAVVDQFIVENKLVVTKEHTSLYQLIEYSIYRAKHQMEKAKNNNAFNREIPLSIQFMTFITAAFRCYPGFSTIAKQSQESEISIWKKVLEESIQNGEICQDIDTELMASNFMLIGSGLVGNMLLTDSFDFAIDMYEKQLFELYKVIKK
jgi:AcrR family transcriptional regulator